MENCDYYIYRHLKPCGEVFYIGIGSLENRAYSTLGRNNFWKKVIEKYPNYEVQVLKNNLEWKDACDLEVILISYYGRRDLKTGTLVNLTDGGDGQVNPSEDTRKKMRDAKKGIGGETHYFFGVPKTEEYKIKLRDAKLGKKLTEEHKRKLSKTNKSKDVHGKKVICTVTGQIWDSVVECGRDLEIKNLKDYLNPNRENLKNKTKYLTLFITLTILIVFITITLIKL